MPLRPRAGTPTSRPVPVRASGSWAWMRRGLLAAPALAAALLLLGAAPPSPTPAPSAAPTPPPFTADRVLASLNRALAWYGEARIVMRSVNDAAGGVFTRDDEQTATRLLERAFDAAQAEAALVPAAPSSAAGAAARRAAGERAQLEAAVKQDEADLARLQARRRSAPARLRAQVEREAAAASNRLDLDRLRLQFTTSLEQLDASLPGAEADLARQVQALRDAVPELRGPAAPVPSGAAPSTASNTWTLLHRLVALQRSRSSLQALAEDTTALARVIDADRQTARGALTPLVDRLRALAADPGAMGQPLPDSEREFHALLDRGKAMGAIVLPLREESALVHRFAGDLQGSHATLGRQSLLLLQDLALEMVGVVIALVVIFTGGVLWRIAVVRYVGDPSRRRLLLTVRNVAVLVAVALVLVFRFTSELAALVTALGFAAAGVAFALQNVILAVAGYFSIVAPHGIRVGDRVSLQGPFGYVHGEVEEIGLVRIRLRELAGDPPQPTGRIVVFPNSVVFTGSFFKTPPPP